MESHSSVQVRSYSRVRQSLYFQRKHLLQQGRRPVQEVELPLEPEVGLPLEQLARERLLRLEPEVGLPLEQLARGHLLWLELEVGLPVGQSLWKYLLERLAQLL